MPLALLFVKKGFDVIGIDVNQSKIESLKQNASYIPDVSGDQIKDAASSGKFTGMFNHFITDELFGHLIATVNESIQYFTEIMNLFHTTIEETEHAELYKEISLKLGMCIYITSYFKDPNRTISMLKKNGEDDVIRYLKSNYKRV
ncbi:hypothetical protein [Peribacillus sp. FSL M8-0224]|uniref:hypothetical protein n=1 Tax=Peribacillus sp. FSL M8-0224 TaxID=2921568 RepID=UPI004046BD25|nr:hypothetical protein KY492_05190 [Brevibacterium sp. PAMC21349]